jgi:hypothetical protein
MRTARTRKAPPRATTPDEPAPAAARPAVGHNGGPALEEDDPGASWRLWCWRRASKRAWAVPREIALRRLERAEALGMSYREYALEIMERGRFPGPDPARRPGRTED